jgi:dihydropteroate synthase
MTINCKGRLIDVGIPKVMGILNVTPDSFYDGGKHLGNSTILTHVEKMIFEGADFIDVGAHSSKPNAEFISESEELNRIVPAVESIIKRFPDVFLSIDTFRSKVAQACIERGAAIINDISAGNQDAKMMDVVAKVQVPYIMMHMRGTPRTMQSMTDYSNIVKEMLFYFSKKITMARSVGINDLIIDPGFGFAKTLEQNYEVLRKLDLFQILEMPLLVGLSRKSMVYKPVGSNAEGALNGTTVLNTLALAKGAKILRVHDVKAAVEAVSLFQRTK